MSDYVLGIILGVLIGLIISSFIAVEDKKLIQHNCAYYEKTTGKLIWSDTNKYVH